MIERYINAASPSGGDGTTRALSGANRAFPSITEAVRPYFVSGSLPDHVRLWAEGTLADSDTSGPYAFAGGFYEVFDFVTTPTNYLEIIGNNTTGKWNPNAYRLELTNLNLLGGSKAAHVRLYNIQSMIKITDGNTYTNYRCSSSFWNTAGGAGYWLLKNCIIRYDPSSTSGFGIGFRCYDPGVVGGGVDLINCIAWQTNAHGGNGFESDNTLWAGTNVRVLNGTSIGNYINYANSMKAINCLGKGGWSGVDFVGMATGSDYNASADATADDGGGGSHNRVSQTFTFVDEANGDFHLGAADAGALGHGLADPASGLYLDDASGTIRPAAWAIGALEKVRIGVVRRRSLGNYKSGTRA